MSTIAIERETTIVMNDEEAEARIWSAQPAFWRRMEKLGVAPVSANSHSRSYRVPKAWIVVRPPRQVVLSEQRRAALSARLAEVRRRKFQAPATPCNKGESVW